MNWFLIVLLVVFVIVVGVWFIRSTDSVKLFTQNPIFDRPSGTTSLLPYTYTLPEEPTSTAGAIISSVTSTKDTPTGFRSKDLSPYYGKVRIQSAGVETQGIGSYQRVEIQAELAGKEGVNVSGWVIQTNRSSYLIPTATEVYNPPSFPQQNNIVLRNGHTLSLFSTANPAGVNFRLNKCSGYLAADPLFNPPPVSQCPVPPRRDYITFTGACQEYIMSLSPCQAAAYDAPVPPDDYACRRYLDKLTYGGCVSRYRTDAEFLSPEWWVWAGRAFLDPLHDRLLLFDKKGLLVNEFVY